MSEESSCGCRPCVGVCLDDWVKRMRNVDAYGPEERHIKADGVLCDYLRHVGAGELAEEFEKLKKWYGMSSLTVQALTAKWLARALMGDSDSANACAACGSERTARQDYRDCVSWRQYEIGHLCQDCSDKFMEAIHEPDRTHSS